MSNISKLCDFEKLNKAESALSDLLASIENSEYEDKEYLLRDVKFALGQINFLRCRLTNEKD